MTESPTNPAPQPLPQEESPSWDWEEISAYVASWFAFRTPEAEARKIDVKDLQQVTLEKLWLAQQRQGADFRGHSFRGLASEIARHTWIDALRAAGRHSIRSLDEMDGSLPSPITSASQRVARSEWFALLREDVGRWKPDDRKIFLFLALEERGFSEVAEVLDLSVEAVKKRWYRLRDRVRRRRWLKSFFSMDR